jgi:hypothetical protein
MSTASVKKQSVAATTVICRGQCKYYGCIVTVATATAAVQIRDAVAAAAGTVIDSLAAASAIGTVHLLPHPIQCDTGLTFDLNGATGTVVVLFEGQAP